MINGIGTITSKAPVSVGRSARGAEVVAAAVAGHPGEAAGAVAEIFKSIGDELNQAKLNRNLERGFGRLIASSQAMDDTLRQGFASVVSHLGLVSGNVESLRRFPLGNGGGALGTGNPAEDAERHPGNPQEAA